MGKAADIFFQLIGIWAKENEIYSKQGSIKSVNESERTCIVTPSDGGPDILDVSLEADYTEDTSTNPKGFFLVPKVGSLVIVSFLDKTEGYISAWTEIDKVISIQEEWIFNSGEFGGLTKLEELTNRLNDYEDLFSQLKQDLNTWVPVPSDGGAALKTILTTGFLTEQIPSSSVSDFENEKVKH